MSLFLSVPFLGKAHGQGSLPIVGVFSSTYGSANITQTSLTVGSQFSVQINVTNALPFNAYEFALYFDQNYISLHSYEISTGTVFNNPYKSPSSYDNPGALRLSVVNLNSLSQPGGLFTGGSGTLVNITFSVMKSGGVSPLTLAAGTGNPSSSAAPPSGLCALCPPGSPNWTRLVDGVNRLSYGVETVDGYFKNVAGKSGPVASFRSSPTNPLEGNTITFNATASFDPDNRLEQYNGILEYLWDFGDLSGSSNTTVHSPVTTHLFVSSTSSGLINAFQGNFSVRLTVVDRDDGFQAMKVTLVTILPPPTHCVAVDAILTNVYHVNPGQDFPFTVNVKDTGTFQETFNLTITYGPPNATLAVIPNQSIKPNQLLSFHQTLPAAHLPAGVYSIVATIQLVRATNCADGTLLNQFSINPPNSAGLLLELVGGIVGVAGAVVAIGVIRRRRGVPEPL